MKKKEFEEFLKKQNQNATISFLDKEDSQPKIQYPVHSVFSEQEEYFELYHDFGFDEDDGLTSKEVSEQEASIPCTIGEILKNIKDYDNNISVNFLAGNEEARNDMFGQEIEIEDLIIHVGEKPAKKKKKKNSPGM